MADTDLRGGPIRSAAEHAAATGAFRLEVPRLSGEPSATGTLAPPGQVRMASSPGSSRVG
jgi:hypothetical protein